MNVKANVFPLVIALSVLSAHALLANDEEKKKPTRPPPSARPEHSTASQAPVAHHPRRETAGDVRADPHDHGVLLFHRNPERPANGQRLAEILPGSKVIR